MSYGQSSIGTHFFNYDEATYKFKFFVPVTGELSSFGSSPDKEETTPIGSKNKTYVTTYTDTTDITQEYNYDPVYYKKANECLNDRNEALPFAIVLPDHSAFIRNATGSNSFAGGAAMKGSFTLVANNPDLWIEDITKVFTDEQVKILTSWGVQKASAGAVTTTDKFSDLIDWDSIPADLENTKPVQP